MAKYAYIVAFREVKQNPFDIITIREQYRSRVLLQIGRSKMKSSNSWFEITLSMKWRNEQKKRIYKKAEGTPKERNREILFYFREKRGDLVTWGVRTKHRTKTAAKKEFQKIPKRYRKQYEICECCSIPELDALFR